MMILELCWRCWRCSWAAAGVACKPAAVRPGPRGGGWLPIVVALPLMIQLFLGIETATEVGGEVADAKRVVPLGMAGALGLTVVVYLAVTYAALSILGPQALAASQAPLLDAAKAALGPWATPLIVTAAVLALTKSMNAIFLVYARFLFAMGRSAWPCPAVLGRVHPRFRHAAYRHRSWPSRPLRRVCCSRPACSSCCSR